MTRDEHRIACIEGMSEAILLTVTTTEPPKGTWPSVALATAAFDALHGIAWLVPVEDTADWDEERTRGHWNWRRMAASRDLTNPPERKP